MLRPCFPVKVGVGSLLKYRLDLGACSGYGPAKVAHSAGGLHWSAYACSPDADGHPLLAIDAINVVQ